MRCKVGGGWGGPVRDAAKSAGPQEAAGLAATARSERGREPKRRPRPISRLIITAPTGFCFTPLRPARPSTRRLKLLLDGFLIGQENAAQRRRSLYQLAGTGL